jgi:hypothetical protein
VEDACSVPGTREELHRLIMRVRLHLMEPAYRLPPADHTDRAADRGTRRTARVAALEETDRGIAAMSGARAHPVLKDRDKQAIPASPGGETAAPHRIADALANVAATLAAVEAFVSDVLRLPGAPGRRPSTGDKR